MNWRLWAFLSLPKEPCAADPVFVQLWRKQGEGTVLARAGPWHGESWASHCTVGVSVCLHQVSAYKSPPQRAWGRQKLTDSDWNYSSWGRGVESLWALLLTWDGSKRQIYMIEKEKQSLLVMLGFKRHRQDYRLACLPPASPGSARSLLL
jgi:hypothetical protein